VPLLVPLSTPASGAAEGWAFGSRRKVRARTSGPCTAAACRRLSRARIVRAPRAGTRRIQRPQPLRYAGPGSRTKLCSGRRWRVPNLGAIYPANGSGFASSRSSRSPRGFAPGRGSWSPTRVSRTQFAGCSSCQRSVRSTRPPAAQLKARRWAASFTRTSVP
jgi:hypothetical protein